MSKWHLRLRPLSARSCKLLQGLHASNNQMRT